MPERRPEHWLYRLTADEWLRAADKELDLCRASFVQKNQRAAVAYARRAAGMALNAVLWHREDPSYGRSYMDHLAALQEDPAAPAEVRAAAAALRQLPTALPFVVLGKGDPAQAEPAERVVGYARDLLVTVLRK